MRIALVHETFDGPDGPQRLARRLAEARSKRADLAVLPELPLDPWVAASRKAREADAEAPDGRRHLVLATAAREAGIGLLGGAIVREASSGRRKNRALLFDAAGRLLARYDKLHVPAEEGFWESDHYDEGDAPPRRVDGFGLPLGIQVCSDLNRPEGCHLLGAQGTAVVLVPRCTPPVSYDRWLLVARANAVTSCVWIVSVNRPLREAEPAGGRSFVVAPDGRVVVETSEPLTLVTCDGEELTQARREYPGYLNVRAELYARGWSALAATSGS